MMSQSSGGDEYECWRCINSACRHPTIPLSVGIKFPSCPFCLTVQTSQEATSQTNKPGQEVTDSLHRAPLHPEADLAERASNLELSTPNISETRTQGYGSLENTSQTPPTSRNISQVQFSPEGNVARHTGAKPTESHSAGEGSSQQKPSNDPPITPGEKAAPDSNGPPGTSGGKTTPGYNDPPGETSKPDSGPPGKNPTPDNNGPCGNSGENLPTPDNSCPPDTPAKKHIPGTTDGDPRHQSDPDASGAGNKDSHPTGKPKVSCFCVVRTCMNRESHTRVKCQRSATMYNRSLLPICTSFLFSFMLHV